MMTAASLAESRVQTARVNHETYKLILEQCYACIRACNARKLFMTTFAVPSFFVGRPRYTHEHALRYVVSKLERGSFVVQLMPPTHTVLHVSWAHARARELPKPKPKPKWGVRFGYRNTSS